MAIATIPGYDATGANIAALPVPDGPYVYAGYVTGSDGVPWSAADWAKYPAAIRIAQSRGLAADEDAYPDVLDYENGAATIDDIAPWAAEALSSYRAGLRPGQRSPAVYASRSDLTAVCNALAAAGVTGIGLWVASWGLTPAEATAMVANASGPYPVTGVQYASESTYDVSVLSLPWVSAVSREPVTRVATKVSVSFADGTTESWAV